MSASRHCGCRPRYTKRFITHPGGSNPVVHSGHSVLLLHICDIAQVFLRVKGSPSGGRSRVVTIAGGEPGDARLAARACGGEGTAMNEETGSDMTTGTLTWERVVEGALKQAARHEHALRACLAELGGYDAPTSDLAES